MSFLQTSKYVEEGKATVAGLNLLAPARLGVHYILQFLWHDGCKGGTWSIVITCRLVAL